MGTGKNFLSLANSSSKFKLAVPFSIKKGLKLYANDFMRFLQGKAVYMLLVLRMLGLEEKVISAAVKAVCTNCKTIKSISDSSVKVSKSPNILDLTQLSTLKILLVQCR